MAAWKRLDERIHNLLTRTHLQKIPILSITSDSVPRFSGLGFRDCWVSRVTVASRISICLGNSSESAVLLLQQHPHLLLGCPLLSLLWMDHCYTLSYQVCQVFPSSFFFAENWAQPEFDVYLPLLQHLFSCIQNSVCGICTIQRSAHLMLNTFINNKQPSFSTSIMSL